MSSETEYGFKLQITSGSANKVEIQGYCSAVDKDRLLSVALKMHHTAVDKDRLLSVALKMHHTELRPFVGLTLEEVEDIIKSNITITDQRLHDGVYAVAVDIETALKNKNTIIGDTN